MNAYTCKGCGVDVQTAGRITNLCPVCAQKDYHTKHPLADAPPMPSSEIEAIKVAMMETGWVWKE